MNLQSAFRHSPVMKKTASCRLYQYQYRYRYLPELAYRRDEDGNEHEQNGVHDCNV